MLIILFLIRKLTLISPFQKDQNRASATYVTKPSNIHVSSKIITGLLIKMSKTLIVNFVTNHLAVFTK